MKQNTKKRQVGLVLLLAAFALIAGGVGAYVSQGERETCPVNTAQLAQCSGECATCPAKCDSTEPQPAAGAGTPTVNKRLCNGCEKCVLIAPKTFALDKKGKAEVINPTGDTPEKIQSAARACRRGAIEIK